MTRLAIRSLAFLLALGPTLRAGGPQQTVFRGTSDTVRVFVTVTDDDDRLVTTLGREDFEVRDNGRPQPLTLFDNTPQPIHLIVMLDLSGSMAGNLPLLRAACEQLLGRLAPGDVARLGTFADEIVISPAFTRDAAALLATLPRSIDPGAPTPLWRALDRAMTAFEGVDGRRVILVLSDGKDSGPRRFGERFVTQVEVVDRAVREDVMIYGIGLRSRPAARARPGAGADLRDLLTADLPDPGLGDAAVETGGGYAEIGPRDDLAAAFARVADELHSQYLLGFTPPARDGKTHRLDVRLRARGLDPRARRSYEAPEEETR
jgi:Ca-activated chloride channel family protein